MGSPMRYQPQGPVRLNASYPLVRGATVFPLAVSPVSYGVNAGVRTTLFGTTSTKLGPIGKAFATSSAAADYIKLGAIPSMTTIAFTALVVCKFDSFSSTITIFESGSGLTGAGSSNNSFQFRIETNGGLGAVQDNVANLGASPANVITAGKYFVAAVSYGSGFLRIAVDGRFVYEVASSRTFADGNFSLMTKEGTTSLEKAAGEVALFAYWPRLMTSVEMVALTATPWALFDAGSISSAYQAAIASAGSVPAGGAITYSYTSAGGFVFSGAALKVRSATKAATGGLQLSGAAPQARGVSKAPAGGILLAGSAPQTRGRAIAPAGGLTLSGASSIMRSIARAAAGGLKFAGAAALSATAQVQARVITPVGGLLLAGAAAVSRATSRAVSGGITFSGHAVKTAGAAGALLASLLPIFARRRRRK